MLEQYVTMCKQYLGIAAQAHISTDSPESVELWCLFIINI